MAQHNTRKGTTKGRAFRAECRYRAQTKRTTEPLDLEALRTELHAEQRARMMVTR